MALISLNNKTIKLKLSHLSEFLEEKLDLEEFKNYISAEVKQYKFSHGKSGVSIPVYVDDDIQLMFTKSFFAKICDDYLSGKISIWELKYVTDCITLRQDLLYEFDDLVDFLDSLIELKETDFDLRYKVQQIKKEVLNY